MPFRSAAQRRLCYSLRARGNTSWNCEEWEKKTKGKLPERIRPQRNPKNSYFTNDVLVYIAKGKTIQSVIKHFSDHTPGAVKGAITRLENRGKVRKTVQGKVRRI